MTTYTPRSAYLLTHTPPDAYLDPGALFPANDFGFTAAFGFWPPGAQFEQRNLADGELVAVWTVQKWYGSKGRNVLQNTRGKLIEFNISSSIPRMRRHNR